MVVVRAMVNTDKRRVFELYEEAFGEYPRKRFENRWSWQFERNPANELQRSHIWVAEIDGVVVGHLASFPCRFQLCGEVTLLHHDCDLLVAQSARRQGIAQKLVEAYDQLDNPISNAIANYTSANRRIRERLGYRAVHLAPHCTLALSADSLTRLALRSRRSWRRFERAPWWLIARGLGEFAYRGRRLLSRRDHTEPRYSIAPITAATSIFDELWQRARPDYANVAVRDKSFVDWRYFKDPEYEHTVLGAFEGDRLVGYLVYCEASEYQLRTGRILDAFCALGDRECLGPLLSVATADLRNRGVDLVRCLGLHPELRAVVQRQLTHSPARLNRPSWLLAASAGRNEACYEPQGWHVSYADSDLAFS